MSNRYWISVGAVALAAAVAGVYVARVMNQPAVPDLETGTSLPQPRPLTPFNLVDTHGAAAGTDTLRGHSTLVFFGFTHCPDVCPTTLALLANVQRQVAISDLKIALITVDPERDTPEQLGNYIAAFNGEFIGLTGSPPEIVKTMKAFGVAASRVDLAGGSYTMDHSATIFAVDAGARIVAVFTPPFNSAGLTRDIRTLQSTLAMTR
jgi:protein SCO1/2